MNETTIFYNFMNVERDKRSGYLSAFQDDALTYIPNSIADMDWLTSLNVSHTQISELGSIIKLRSLKSLNISYTNIISLDGIEKLINLEELFCHGLQIKTGVEEALSLSSLTSLVASHSTASIFGSTPRELLSNGNENCLPRVRDYYESLKSGSSKLNRLKLFVYGNGEVGKTQLLRQLNPPPTAPAYDVRVPTTHGVRLQSFNLVNSESADPDLPELYVRAWDFGGQDLYHGAHALFLKDKAIHLIAWTPERETGSLPDPYGFPTLNHPIEYWVSFARLQRSKASAIILTQTQVDPGVVRKPWSRAELSEIKRDFQGLLTTAAVSAKHGTGFDGLEASIVEAANWVLDAQDWELISNDWLKVEKAIQDIQAQNEKVIPSQRKRRVISIEEFEDLCRSIGLRSGFETLLQYLSTTGLVFWDANLFRSKVIIDQQWALDAIYSVFDRLSCITKLRRAQGRFSKHDLADWIWDEQGFSETEQSLFVDFMRSCRICFPLTTVGKEVIYLAPNALPSRESVEKALALSWTPDWETLHARFEYALLHDGFLRSIMHEIGQRSGSSVTFWDNGLQFYDRQTQSRARIVQQKDSDGWSGYVEVDIQTNPEYRSQIEARIEIIEGESPADILSGWISLLFEETEAFCGIKRTTKEAKFEAVERTGSGSYAELDPQDDPDEVTGYFVSYAWGDDSDDGKHRAKIVDQFCQNAEERNIAVNIDKDALRVGDSITAYMDRLARGSRVFLFLSQRYLHSRNCMNELVTAWIYSRRNWDEFHRRVKIFVLPCAKIFAAQDRFDLKQHWQMQWLDLKTQLEQYDQFVMSKAGSPERIELDHIGNIATYSFEILNVVADRLQESNFDEFCDNWLKKEDR